ncbi:hypothetical protein [Streptomyces tsukubensis]|uniref:hypothetical protein n=1 Tax=Streptomyces tsukubensis TaxID=83656 RepID=UPI00344CE6CA
MLTLKTKSPVRFEWTDGDVESVVVLLPDDTEADLLRKIRRLLELAGTPALPVREPGQTLGNPIPAGLTLPPATGNGWAGFDLAVLLEAPEVPERLAGEVELITPGEDV